MPPADDLAASQADLNGYLAHMITGDAFTERRYVDRALTALELHNWASGYDLCGSRPPDGPIARQSCARGAIEAVRAIDAMSRGDDNRARREAEQLARGLPTLARSGLPPDAPAAVYLITHDKLGAAKVGIGDVAGLRLAQHRREGWQVLAMFRVTATSAAAIERNILEWWRGPLGLPSYLTRDQMPQAGWTETVATARVDLAATMTRICNLAAEANRQSSTAD